MTLLDVFCAANRQCYARATQYVILTGFASISPLLLTALIFAVIDEKLLVMEFISHGEASISAIGILLWAGILVARELKPPFAHRSTFQFVSFFLFAVSTVLYTALQIATVKHYTIVPTVLSIVSFLLIACSLIFGWLVILIDSVREILNPDNVRKDQIASLSAELKELDNE